MCSDREVLILIRDLAHLMRHVRPSSLVPTNIDPSMNRSKWHEAIEDIEITAGKMLADDADEDYQLGSPPLHLPEPKS